MNIQINKANGVTNRQEEALSTGQEVLDLLKRQFSEAPRPGRVTFLTAPDGLLCAFLPSSKGYGVVKYLVTQLFLVIVTAEGKVHYDLQKFSERHLCLALQAARYPKADDTGLASLKPVEPADFLTFEVDPELSWAKLLSASADPTHSLRLAALLESVNHRLVGVHAYISRHEEDPLAGAVTVLRSRDAIALLAEDYFASVSDLLKRESSDVAVEDEGRTYSPTSASQQGGHYA